MAKSGFICKEDGACWYYRPDGMGGSLNPPGDAEHRWSIVEERGGREVGSMSLRGALEYEWVPVAVKMVAKRLLKKYTPICEESWVQSCYNYFRNCYSPDGQDRNANRMIVDRENNLPAEWHLAVMHIQKFFPQHEPRLDLIANDGPLGDWSKTPKTVTVQA